MANPTHRLRYFDGEFLRSNDMTDEQTYHVGMRRALTLGLHSPGIVNGLVLEQDANSVAGLMFVSVSAGLAIDQAGREMLVAAPYLLSSDNVLSRAGLQSGDNEVWITYTEAATGLPAAGYALCNDAGQNTRIAESFQLVLRPKGATTSADGTDPDKDLLGIRLGTVTLQNDAVNGWTVSAFDALGRRYVGIHAQSIVAPDQIDTDGFSVAAQNVTPPAAGSPAIAPPGYLDVWPSVFARGNAFIEQNLVLGDDFKLDNSVYPKLPAANSMPTNGNLKVNGDLFLNGGFYGLLNGQWLDLGSYIMSLVPDVQIGVKDFALDNRGTNVGVSDTSSFVVTTNLPSYKSFQVVASVAGFTLLNNADLAAMQGAQGGKEITVQASATGVPVAGSPKDLNVSLKWTVGPSFPKAANDNQLPLTHIWIAYFVTFTPGP